MMDWLTRGRHRLPLLLGIYFAMHVAIRMAMSPSLDYDESEQVLLSQTMMLGYNSQPPLYTWMQRAVFEVFGTSIFSLALLKNLLIWMTYALVFVSIRKVTDSLHLATVGTLGLLTMPQIAWESHRDLSHTVAATFATTLLLYAVVSLRKEPSESGRLRWYALIGLTVGLGILFKYNFAIVVIAFVVAVISIEQYRPLLMDQRILIAVAIAGVMIAPHAWWMVQHPDLVSSKTVGTLTSGQSDYWLANVGKGLSAMTLSLLGCCAFTLVVFLTMFVRKRPEGAAAQPNPFRSERLLLERFLLTVLIILFLIVLSGHAVEFKNRWFQPFICLVPAYLALLFAPSVLSQRRAMNFSAAMTILLMVIILTAVMSRPMTSRYRGNYSWLNIPYQAAARQICADGQPPQIIVAANARIAGNMKVQFPDSIALSVDTPQLTEPALKGREKSSSRVLLLAGDQKRESIDNVTRYAEETLGFHLHELDAIQMLSLTYLYGGVEDKHEFVYRERKPAPGTQLMRIGQQPKQLH